MKITLDLPDDTIWALMESTGEENLEDAVATAIAGYLRLERAERRQALADFPVEQTSGANGTGEA